MTQILTTLLFISIGFLMAIIPAIYIHRRHKQAWQSEYRRLMGGIGEAADCLRHPGKIGYNRPRAARILAGIFYNDPNWPRS